MGTHGDWIIVNCPFRSLLLNVKFTPVFLFGLYLPLLTQPALFLLSLLQATFFPGLALFVTGILAGRFPLKLGRLFLCAESGFSAPSQFFQMESASFFLLT